MLEPRTRPVNFTLPDADDAADAALPPDHVVVPASAWSGGGQQRPHAVDDTLIEETPVALVYNGISHAVMLATPSDLEDFAYGFSLTEGIIPTRSDIYGMDIVPTGEGIEIRIELAAERFAHLKLRRRSLAGRTGCGLCGVRQPGRRDAAGGAASPSLRAVARRTRARTDRAERRPAAAPPHRRRPRRRLGGGRWRGTAGA